MKTTQEYATLAATKAETDPQRASVYAQLAIAAAILEAAQPAVPRIETKTFGDDE